MQSRTNHRTRSRSKPAVEELEGVCLLGSIVPLRSAPPPIVQLIRAAAVQNWTIKRADSSTIVPERGPNDFVIKFKIPARSYFEVYLVFDSCASAFDVTPLLMGRGSHRSPNPGATPSPGTP